MELILLPLHLYIYCLCYLTIEIIIKTGTGFNAFEIKNVYNNALKCFLLEGYLYNVVHSLQNKI